MGKKVLIVEDERDIVTILSLAIEKEGYEVVEAYDGLDAIDKIEKEHPDLILLDIMMPQLDGNTVNLKLKNNPATAAIPVIVMSGRGGGRDNSVLQQEMQVTAYLEKPFAVSDLIEKIKELLPL